jgi:hypothetical protein
LGAAPPTEDVHDAKAEFEALWVAPAEVVKRKIDAGRLALAAHFNEGK